MHSYTEHITPSIHYVCILWSHMNSTYLRSLGLAQPHPDLTTERGGKRDETVTCTL